MTNKGRSGPFWNALGAALVDVAGENKPCLLELWWQGVNYGRCVEKAASYRCCADQIDSGTTTNDLRRIADGLRVGIDESRDAGQAGPCARAHVKSANSYADFVCCDSVPTPSTEAIDTLREQLKEAERQSASLTWLFTHCLAIGMDCKSDSGKWEHDIALFTSNQKKEIESLRDQFAQAEINFALEHDDKVELEQQLATMTAHNVMLREALEKVVEKPKSHEAVCVATQALAATEADLDGVILCERKSVAWFRPRTEGEAMNLGRGELMAIAAVRYCLGRRSYIVGDCADWLIEVWTELNQRTRSTIQQDIEKAFSDDDEARELCTQHFPLGMDMDRAEWTRVRKLWKA